MNKKDFENADCLCHLRPPCNKCMNSCPDCQGYLAEDGEEESCRSCMDKMLKVIVRRDTLKEVAGLARDKATAMDNGRAIISFSVMDAFAQELERMASE